MKSFLTAAMLCGSLTLCSCGAARPRQVERDTESDAVLVRTLGYEPPRTAEFVRSFAFDRGYRIVGEGSNMVRRLPSAIERRRGDEGGIVTHQMYLDLRVSEEPYSAFRLTINRKLETEDTLSVAPIDESGQKLADARPGEDNPLLQDLKGFIEAADSKWLPKGLARR
ncbi:MAG: hypothetical protein CMJ31_11590 [Phycisphaerae bacterium]|nr:hypothetical protein [Phycisphaerae bacterium]